MQTKGQNVEYLVVKITYFRKIMMLTEAIKEHQEGGGSGETQAHRKKECCMIHEPGIVFL